MMGFLSDGWDPFDVAGEMRRKKKAAEAENVAAVEGYDPQNENTKAGLLGGLIDKPVAPWETEKAEQSTGEYWAKNILGINSLFSPLAKKTHAAETKAYNTSMREAAEEDAARQLKYDHVDEYVNDMTDGNIGNDARAYLRGRANDIEADDMATAFYNDPMFANRNLDDLTPIMQTATQVMEAHNARPENAENQWDIKDAFDHVKKYDPDLNYSISSANALGSGSVDADLSSFATAQGSYIQAHDNNQMYNDGLARVDEAIALFDPDRPEGALDTGVVNGFLYNTFGVGPEGLATLDVLGKDATIEKLMSFKGPTTDFEFTKAEAAAFASIMKGEPANLEILNTVRGAIEKASKRNSTSAEAAFGTMRDFTGEKGSLQNMKGTFDIYEKNYAPWWEQSPDPDNPNAIGNGSGEEGEVMSEADALEWLRTNNTPANREFFEQTYGKSLQ